MDVYLKVYLEKAYIKIKKEYTNVFGKTLSQINGYLNVTVTPSIGKMPSNVENAGLLKGNMCMTPTFCLQLHYY